MRSRVTSRALGRIPEGVKVYGFYPEDETLESVFAYLTERR